MAEPWMIPTEAGAREKPPRGLRGLPPAALWVIGLSAVVIALDIVFPDQITIGVLYVVPLLAGMSLRSERALYVLTLVVIAAIFAFFLAFPSGDLRVGLLDRALSAVAMLGVAYLAARQIRTNRALEDRERRLSHLMELQTDFVRAVSHDIRAPLGAVLGYVELLESGVGAEPPSERQTRLLSGIARSCRSAMLLTDNLLTTSKLDTGDFPVERAPFDLVATVRELIGEATPSAPGDRRRILLEAPPSLLVDADVLRVRQILLNLLSNALKYSPPESCVRVDVEERAGSVRVSVADEGPGIAPEEMERIFEPFYQMAGRREGGGVGLGLPLARRLARALGGDVTVESVVGTGSVFRLELPGGGEAGSGKREGVGRGA